MNKLTGWHPALSPRPLTGICIWLLLSGLVFCAFYPTHFGIGDEAGYYRQALRWLGKASTPDLPGCDGLPSVEHRADYPPGTAWCVAGLLSVGGKPAIFWLGWLSWAIGTAFIALTLRKEGKLAVWALYPVLFLPLLVLTRSIMSDLPSFLLSAVFAYSWCIHRHSRAGMFLSGLLGGLSLLFRETNFLWVLPFWGSALWLALPYRNWFSAGFLLGLLPRLMASWWLWDDPFYWRSPGIAWSLAALPAQSMFYLAALVLLLPGGLWFWWKTRHPDRTAIGISLLLFLLFYGSYGYDAFDKSGYKGIILQGRFLMPLLPWLALAAAHGPHSLSPKKQKAGFVLIFLIFVLVQAAGWSYNRAQRRFTLALDALPADVHVSFSPDESLKYWYALSGPKQLLNGNLLTPSQLACREVWYIHTITRSESADWRKKSTTAQRSLHNLFRTWNVALIDEQQAMDGARLLIWRAKKNPIDG